MGNSAGDSSTVLVRLRDDLLETGDWPDYPLRPEIANSWRRCLLSGVNPDRLATQEAPRQKDGLLSRAARGVLQKRADQLAGTATGLILADRNGVVLDRWTDDGRLSRLLDESRSDLGSVLDEAVAGTNGIGTVLEEQRPVVIKGAEHFTNVFQAFTCVGVPIRHPVTRQLQGVLNITCRYEDGNSLILPFALETAHEIERRLYLDSSRNERLLLEQFLAAEKRSNRPVIVLNDQIVITNPAAARLIDDVGRTRLWEHAAQAIDRREQRVGSLSLESGALLNLQCSPIGDGASVIGAIIHVQPAAAPSSPRRIADRGSTKQETLDGLVGHSAAWRESCDQARWFRDSDVPMLFVGEPGTGKLSLVDALFSTERREERLTVLDGALEPVEGAVAWTHALRAALKDPRRVVVLRHLEALDDTAAQAACSLIDAFRVEGARVCGTLTKSEGAAARVYQPLVDRLMVAAITVPPLRDRLEDLPGLLTELSRRHGADPSQVRWRTDAVQVLSRLEWPANVRELENVVRRVLVTHRSGDIRADDLPDDVRSQAPRRRLSQLERLECDAIVTALRRAGGNKSEAASLLGISRATLYRKIRSYGVDLGTTAY
ncbi:sigma-54-dependent Fis family transcriptional regulator [Streptomyces sp. NPDC003697]